MEGAGVPHLAVSFLSLLPLRTMMRKTAFIDDKKNLKQVKGDKFKFLKQNKSKRDLLFGHVTERRRSPREQAEPRFRNTKLDKTWPSCVYIIIWLRNKRLISILLN